MGIKFKDLNLNNAFLFAAAFNDPEICRIALELILGAPIPKVNVKTEHNILLSPDSKCVRLDVNARSEYDVNYNIEAQNSNEKNIIRRSRYYQAELDVSELKPGDDYNKLPDSYVIFICTFDPFDEGLYRYTFVERCEENGQPLGDGTCKIFLNTKGKNKDDVPKELVTFLGYFEDSSDTYVEKIDNKSISELHNRIVTLKKSREWEEGYMRLEEFLLEQTSEARKEARAEGLKEGRAEGRAEGQQEGVYLTSVKSIITVLSTKGDVTEDVKAKIENETDVEVLNKWLTVAAVVPSVEEFEKEISKNS